MDSILGKLDLFTWHVDDISVFPGAFRSTSSTYRPSLTAFMTMDWWSDLTNAPSGCQKLNFLATTSLCRECTHLHQRSAPSSISHSLRRSSSCRISWAWSTIIIVAYVIKPLYAALARKPKSLLWEMKQEEAFTKAEKSPAAATALSFPTLNAPLFLSTDSSNIAMGVVLDQIVDGKLYPLEFFSRKLNASQRKSQHFCYLLHSTTLSASVRE